MDLIFISVFYIKNTFLKSLLSLTRSRPHLCTHHEVELLRLLLVGSPLGDAGLAEVRLWHCGLDWFGGPAVVEALRHIVVFNGHHVLDGGQGCLWCLFDLWKEEKVRKSCLHKSLMSSLQYHYVTISVYTETHSITFPENHSLSHDTL